MPQVEDFIIQCPVFNLMPWISDECPDANTLQALIININTLHFSFLGQ